MSTPTRPAFRRNIIGIDKINNEFRVRLLGKYLEDDHLLAYPGRLLNQLTGATGRKTPSAAPADPEVYWRNPERPERVDVDELIEHLAQFDVVSFDIFDTALLRTVEKPGDVFRIMGLRMGDTKFIRLRKAAEAYARTQNDRYKATREVTLSEIYAVLEDRYGIDRAWEQVEKELEKELSRPNPYAKKVYDALLARGRTMVFTSDMYLPREVIEGLLEHNGFGGYDRLFLSNEENLRKGDGTLQPLLAESYPGASIVHIGDNLSGDVTKTQEAGLAAVWLPDNHGALRQNGDSLAGSFYEAVVGAALDTGMWDKDLHYTHGFRVGGILALGYVEFIEELVAAKDIEAIIFAGRDCDVISQVYRTHFGTVPSTYLDVSRHAVNGITLDANFYDYIGRSVLRWYSESRNSRPVAQILEETGFDYLIPELDAADIDPRAFPASVVQRRFEQFLWDHRTEIEEHNAPSVEAAAQLLTRAVGGARKVLVVDVGWSGTAPTSLRHFFATRLAHLGVEVTGALMATSRNIETVDAIESGFIHAYTYSPTANMDLTRWMQPSGRRPVRETDMLHLPLEYLFTSPTATATGYGFDEDGNPIVIRGNNVPPNADQIRAMHDGILDFVARYRDFSRGFESYRPISSYVAMGPLQGAIRNRAYCYLVYKDFLYDAAPVLFGKRTYSERFGELFDHVTVAASAQSFAERRTGAEAEPARPTPKILFVSPEMIYAGAPRSLLRMARAALELGYEPLVWTARSGPFAAEFAALGIQVHTRTDASVKDVDVKQLAADGVELVVCNTIVTDGFVRAFEGKIPLVWYVREATNLPNFFRGAPARLETLRTSNAICCVSEYARDAIAQFTDRPIAVVHNAVEDDASLARPYTVRKDGIFRFWQAGTIEQRKGYDVLLAAYKALPDGYRECAEVHVAGGLINSGTTFATYLFGQIKDVPGFTYHGVISDNAERVGLMSQMDAVIVASRDESYSLVAAEGAMLGKPLIVTENVGAKFLVGPDNGHVVETGSVTALRDAMVALMDRSDEELAMMDKASRARYESQASMTAYVRDLGAFFAERIAVGARKPATVRRMLTAGVTAVKKRGSAKTVASDPKVVVSLTSFPARITELEPCLASLVDGQTHPADKVVLYLAREQFPDLEADLPDDLLARRSDRFEIRWVEEDLRGHKKYFQAVRDFPDVAVITADDDLIYNERLVQNLIAGHLQHPHALIADRVNLPMFREDGTFRRYEAWPIDVRGFYRGVLDYQVLPTSGGGVLFPPGALPVQALDAEAIKSTALHQDDLWLKIWANANGYPTFAPIEKAGYVINPGPHFHGMWRQNVFFGENDAALSRILAHYDATIGNLDQLLGRLRNVAPDGTYITPEDIAFDSLLEVE